MKYLLLFLLFNFQIGICQLGKKESELHKYVTGKYDVKDVQKDFTVYGYFGKMPLLNGKSCDELVSFFIDNKTKICYQVNYASCSAAANSYVKFFNKVAVQIGQNEWKNYENNTIYKLKVDGKLCLVEHYFDYNEKKIEQKNSSDKSELIAKAKIFFEKFIAARLKEEDELGYANEYGEVREFFIGDINLDGVPDVVVLYTIEGVGGGNNWSRNILLLVFEENEVRSYGDDMVFSNFSDKRKFIGIRNGYAVFETISNNSSNSSKGNDTNNELRIGYGIRGDKIIIRILE